MQRFVGIQIRGYDVANGKEGGGKGCGPVKAVGVGAALHSQLFIDGGDAGIGGRGEEGGRRISAPGSVIFRLSGRLLNPEEIPISQLLGGFGKGLKFLRTFQILRTAGGGNTGNTHIQRHLSKNHHSGQNEQTGQGSLLSAVQVEKQTVYSYQCRIDIKGIERKFFGIHQLFTEKDKGQPAADGGYDLRDRNMFQLIQSFITHGKKKEGVQKRLSAGQTVRKMKTMPDIIGNIPGKANQHDKEKNTVHNFLLEGNLLVHNIQREQKEYAGTAVNIGPIIQTDFHIHKGHMSGQHVDHGEIGGQRRGKFGAGRGCGFQGIGNRHQQYGSQSPGQKRIAGKTQTHPYIFFPTGARGFALCCLTGRERGMLNHQADEIQYQKQAQHNGNIVVGKNRKGQGNAIEKPLLFLHQIPETGENQRRQPDAIQPHNVPAVGCHVAGQGIGHGKEQGKETGMFKSAAQIDRHGKSRQTCLKDNEIGHKVNDACLGQKYQKQLKRTGQIIGKQGEKVRTQTNLPGIKKAAAVLQLFCKLGKERRILVIHIGAEKTPGSKGIDSLYRKNNQQGTHRQQEREKIDPFPLFAFR